MAILLGLLLGFGWGQGAQAQEATDAATDTAIQVQVEAPAQVAPGQLIRLTLRLETPTPIAAFEAEVRYDPAAAEFGGFSPHLPHAPSLARLSAIDLPFGAAVGAYACATDPCLAQAPLHAQAHEDDTVLAVVELLPLQSGALEIALDHLLLVNEAGQPLPVHLNHATHTIQVGEETAALAAPASLRQAPDAHQAQAAQVSAAMADVTQDGRLSHADVMEVALAWQVSREAGTACALDNPQVPAPQVDINRDGCVDVTDVQLAAAFAADPDSTLPDTPETPDVPDDQGPDDQGPNEEPVDPSELPNHLFIPLLRAGQETVATMAEAAEATETAIEQAAAGLTFVVNSTLDESNATWGKGICETPSGVCTLRAAIAESNAQPGPNTILFDIPGDGVHTIQLTSRLPTLRDETGPTLIDGYSQPGASPNSDPLVSNAQIRIELRGYGSEAFDALAITSAGNTVRGLAFYNFKRALWIYGAGAHGNAIVGNFIGTDAAGSFKYNSTSTLQAHGLHIEQGAYNNAIGGVEPGQRNVVSGNGRHGIGFWHIGTNQNQVLNNLIGISPDGQRSLSNRMHGVDINYGASFNRVGGTGPGERNVLSGNNGAGAEASHTKETTANEIVGNYIGTNVTGDAAPSFAANGGHGVSLKDRVTNNLVAHNVVGNSRNGGIFVDNFGNCCTSGNVIEHNRVGVGVNDAPIGNSLYGITVQASQNRIGPGNIIAHNPVGVQLIGSESFGNTITQNSIFANAGLGIDITPLGQPNTSDPNLPLLQQVSATQVTGTTCGSCAVEIFLADEGEGAYGEGRTLAGSGTAAADGSFTLAIDGAQDGDALTAVAILPDGSTTEFSANKVIGDAKPWQQVFALPGRIEAENYREGGEGVGYHDTTPGNSGGVYRNDDVDIEPTSDTSGGYNTGWTQPGEWLAYDVNIAQAGTYQFTVRMASPSGQRRIRLEVDGVDVSGSIVLPWTGGWQTWLSATTNVNLPAGEHTLRVVAETDRVNLNYFEFALVSP